MIAASQEGKARPGQLGPFDKKWLMLAIQDLETKGSAKEPLGRVVINLADFAAEDGRATQAFVVACSRSIAAAVGEAKLLVTIGCGCTAPAREAGVVHHCCAPQEGGVPILRGLHAGQELCFWDLGGAMPAPEADGMMQCCCGQVRARRQGQGRHHEHARQPGVQRL